MIKLARINTIRSILITDSKELVYRRPPPLRKNQGERLFLRRRGVCTQANCKALFSKGLEERDFSYHQSITA